MSVTPGNCSTPINHRKINILHCVDCIAYTFSVSQSDFKSYCVSIGWIAYARSEILTSPRADMSSAPMRASLLQPIGDPPTSGRCCGWYVAGCYVGVNKQKRHQCLYTPATPMFVLEVQTLVFCLFLQSRSKGDKPGYLVYHTVQKSRQGIAGSELIALLALSDAEC